MSGSITETRRDSQRAAGLVLVVLVLMVLAAVVGRLTASDSAGDKFSGEIINVSPNGILIKTDDGQQIHGLLAYEGKPLNVGDKVTGREFGDPDVIYVDPLP
jgi:hypothetical protein